MLLYQPILRFWPNIERFRAAPNPIAERSPFRRIAICDTNELLPDFEERSSYDLAAKEELLHSAASGYRNGGGGGGDSHMFLTFSARYHNYSGDKRPRSRAPSLIHFAPNCRANKFYRKTRLHVLICPPRLTMVSDRMNPLALGRWLPVPETVVVFVHGVACFLRPPYLPRSHLRCAFPSPLPFVIFSP